MYQCFHKNVKAAQMFSTFIIKSLTINVFEHRFSILQYFCRITRP